MITTKKTEKEIQYYSKSKYPNEACGLILKNDEFIPLENIHSEPKSNFLIDPFDYLKYKNEIKFIFHSHTREDQNSSIELLRSPSKTDMENQMLSDVPWALLACDAITATSLEIFGWQVICQDFLNKSFIHGIRDCYSLIRNYFFSSRNILLQEVPRQNLWWESQDENLYLKSFLNVGFNEEKRENNEFNIGELLLFKVGKTKSINHGGVYIGSGYMLHHLYGQLSCKTPIAPYLKFLEKVIVYDESKSPRNIFTDQRMAFKI